LQRMRELAIQSANGTNGDTERTALNKEIVALKAELDRISSTTAFGGRNLLDGTFGSSTLQVGSEANQTIALNIATTNTDQIGTVGKSFTIDPVSGLAKAQTGAFSALTSTDNLSVTLGTNSAVTVDVAGALTASDVAAALNGVDGLSGVSAVTKANINIGAAGGQDALDKITVNIEGFDFVLSDGAAGDLVDADAFSAALETLVNDSADMQALGITATDLSSDGGLDITKADGTNIAISVTIVDDDANDDGTGLDVVVAGYRQDGTTASATSVTIDSDAGGVVDGATSAVTASGTINVRGSLDFSSAVVDSQYGALTIALADTGSEFTAATTTATLGAVTTLGVDSVDISTQSGSQDAIAIIDAAITQIDGFRADLGAIQNRLDSTISNLSNIAENVSAARSRIQDADFAQETANLTRIQILQQAGTAILAQANAAPQSVLSLLQ